jgi:PPM family protein phosphatase
MPVVAHGETHPGKRASNEDTLLVATRLGLFVVADGMGGHRAGEVASAMAVRTVEQSIAAGDEPGGDELEYAVRLANDKVYAASSSDPDYAGMGTTIVAVLVRGAQVVYASVGDSRLYRWRAGALTQLTRDDSWVERMLQEESLSPAEVQQHPMRHVLTEVVGVRTGLDPQATSFPWIEGDVLLLCSDGLHGAVTSDRMQDWLGSGSDVAKISSGLVSEALARGASDNVTAVVVRIDSAARS